ncbi:MAG: FG-GAP repeat domain-containing protein, partial [Bryobacteraceae bacterium]
MSSIRWSMCRAAAAPGVVLVCVLGSAEPPAIRFRELAKEAGIQFVLRDSAAGLKRQIEPMAGGVAVLDYNNDGRPDIYFVNGARQPVLDKPDPSYYNRLYRNNGEGTFTDVTTAAKARGEGFATGVAAADYDNDGFVDLF